MQFLLDRDKEYIKQILKAFEKIEIFVKPYENSEEWYQHQESFDAVLMNFIVIGESAAKISEQLKNQYAQTPWSKIIGLRNIIAHNYIGISADRIWAIIKDYNPVFEEQFTQMLTNL
ncbi:MAG: DUF86 domain-containing protein [Bacteroidetes bacterium]|nr:MAG: DUF86 domain-containing protein [Bacteroidota bacterium]